MWLGGGSGAQGGSGQTPLPFELRSAVVAPAGTGFRVGNRKVCVRTGCHHHRTEGSNDSSGCVAEFAQARRTAVGPRPQLCAHFGGLDASIRRGSKTVNLPSREFYASNCQELRAVYT